MTTSKRPFDSTELGQIIGSYRVLGLLGEGGMGMVFLAEHIRLGHRVALKRLKNELVRQPDAIRQFMDEAKAVNTIRHENIIDVMDVVVSATRAYYLMEYLDGKTLSTLLRESGQLSIQRALHIGFQVSDALAAAHAAGFVHQDIKPSNIFLIDRKGRPDFVKLLDFGMVGLVATLPGALAGALGPIRALGTPAYLSPEQAAGGAVGPASDQYSLGIVLYEMLAGHLPFHADTLTGYLFKHMKIAPPPLRAAAGLPQRIPRELSRVVMRCLEKAPAKRFSSTQELREALSRAAHMTGLSLRSGEPPVSGPAPPRQRFGRTLGGAAVALATLALGGGVLWTIGVPVVHRTVSVRTAFAASLATVTHPTGIRLSIDTVPAGAEVMHIGPPDVFLGVTPLRLRLPGSRAPWQIAIRRAGFENRSLSLEPGRDHSVVVTMLPTPRITASGTAARTLRPPERIAPRRQARPRRTQTVQKLGSTVDPFD